MIKLETSCTFAYDYRRHKETGETVLELWGIGHTCFVCHESLQVDRAMFIVSQDDSAGWAIKAAVCSDECYQAIESKGPEHLPFLSVSTLFKLIQEFSDETP